MFSPPTPNSRAAAGGALLVAFLAGAPSDASQRSNWTIDPVRTHISFSIDAIGYPRTEGEFHRFDGHIDVDFEHPARSRVSFQVDTQSVDLGSTSFSDYPRREPFLNAAPFTATEFSPT